MFRNFLLLSVIFINFTSFASPYEDRLYYERKDFNEDEEGKLLFKVRAVGLRTSAKVKSLPPSQNKASSPIGKLFSSGFGGDAATTFFITDNIAAEMSLGFIFVRTHNSVLGSIAKNYNGDAPGKGKHTYLVPLTVTAQYSIAPYGGIQPYIGAGGHATYVISKIKNVKINNGFGPVVQAGVDLVAKDYSLINFDIKQYFFSPKISYKAPLVSSNISSKLKLNPLVFSVGLGLKF